MGKQKFIDWLFSEGAKSRKILSLVSISSWLLPIFLFLKGTLTTSFTAEQFNVSLKSPEGIQYRGILAIIHATTCFLLAVATPPPKREEEGSYITKKALDRIHIMVISLYGSLALLYAVMAFFIFKETPNRDVRTLNPTANVEAIFEVITATLIFFLYIELSEITVEPKELSSSADSTSPAQVRLPSRARRNRVLFFWFALILAVLSILSIYLSSTLMQTLLRAVVGCLSGVTLAMVVGRLGSLYINPGTGTLFLLYLYAVIQSYAAFKPETTIFFIVTSLALPLKILLWLVFVWAFTDGKLWAYVVEIRNILESQDENQQRATSA